MQRIRNFLSSGALVALGVFTLGLAANTAWATGGGGGGGDGGYLSPFVKFEYKDDDEDDDEDIEDSFALRYESQFNLKHGWTIGVRYEIEEPEAKSNEFNYVWLPSPTADYSYEKIVPRISIAYDIRGDTISRLTELYDRLGPDGLRYGKFGLTPEGKLVFGIDPEEEDLYWNDFASELSPNSITSTPEDQHQETEKKLREWFGNDSYRALREEFGPQGTANSQANDMIYLGTSIEPPNDAEPDVWRVSVRYIF